MMRFLSMLPIVSIGGLITVAIATEPLPNSANLQSASPLRSTSNLSQNLASKSATVPDFLVLGDGGAPSYDELKSTYLARLKMELINIAIEQQLRTSKNTQKIAVLDRLFLRV